MPRFVAFLRGVNPMNLRMADLRACLDDAGYEDVKTVLSSGNVAFSTSAKSDMALARAIEGALTKRLGRSFLIVVRPSNALHRLVEGDPFARFHIPPRAKRVVTFLRESPKGGLLLPVEVDGTRILGLNGRDAVAYYLPNPRGPIFMTLIEKTFGKQQTTRTWETVKRCATA